MEGFPIAPDRILANEGAQSLLLDSQLELDWATSDYSLCFYGQKLKLSLWPIRPFSL